MDYFKNLLKNFDVFLIILPILFGILSVVMLASITYTGETYLTRTVMVQILAYGLGFIGMVAIVFVNYSYFPDYEKFLYAFCIVLQLLVYTPLGVVHSGSRAWLNLGITEFQPGELIKIIFVVLFASHLVRTKDNLVSIKGFLFSCLYAMPLIGIVAIEDFGTAMVMAVIFVGMVFFAGISGSLFLKLAGAFCIAVPIGYRFLQDHQRERIDAFLHPDNLSIGANYQVWQSKVAIGSGGMFGKGLFNGTQKELNFLPVQESDFIFAVIIEELGFVGGAILIALYGFLLLRIWRTANKAKDLYGSLICVGFLCMFGFQIFENIAMTMGMMPVTGITLPFVSAGGTSVMVNMFAIGLIINVGLRTKKINF